MPPFTKPTINLSPDISLTDLLWDDRHALVKYLNDPEISRNTLSIPYPYTAADADWWYHKIHDFEAQHHRPKEWAIRHLPSNELIGGIGITYSAHYGINNTYENGIGYWLAKPYRGQGIVTQAVVALCNYMFEVLKYQRINAFAYLHNIGSQRVLEKAAFEQVAIKPSFLTKDGLPIDVVAFKKMAVQKNINMPD